MAINRIILQNSSVVRVESDTATFPSEKFSPIPSTNSKTNVDGQKVAFLPVVIIGGVAVSGEVAATITAGVSAFVWYNWSNIQKIMSDNHLILTERDVIDILSGVKEASASTKTFFNQLVNKMQNKELAGLINKHIFRSEIESNAKITPSISSQSGGIVVSGTGGPKRPKKNSKKPNLSSKLRPKNITAKKGEPSEFPTVRNGKPTRSDILQGPKDYIQFARTAIDVHRAVLNASLKSNIVKPVSIQIGRLSTSSKLLLNAKVMSPLKATPTGAAFINTVETMAGNVGSSLKLLGNSSAAKILGKAFIFMTEESVKVANGIKKALPTAGAATITALATAAHQGTLIHRREVVGDPNMSREAKIIAKCANLPKGFVFEYMYTDKVEGLKQIGGHAFLVVGVNSPKVILPATGFGQSGVAQPVAAYKESENRAAALFSGSAFAGSGTFVGQIGTPNLNMTYGKNLILGRVQSTLPGIYTGVGPSTDPAKIGTLTKPVDVVGVLMFDLHTKHSYTTLNIGPIGFMVERKRDVQTSVVRTGTDYTLVNPFNEGSRAVLSPLITLNSGYDATGKDIKSVTRISEKIWTSVQGQMTSLK
jgi:hypothetical protein